MKLATLFVLLTGAVTAHGQNLNGGAAAKADAAQAIDLCVLKQVSNNLPIPDVVLAKFNAADPTWQAPSEPVQLAGVNSFYQVRVTRTSVGSDAAPTDLQSLMVAGAIARRANYLMPTRSAVIEFTANSRNSQPIYRFIDLPAGGKRYLNRDRENSASVECDTISAPGV